MDKIITIKIVTLNSDEYFQASNAICDLSDNLSSHKVYYHISETDFSYE